MSSPTESRRMMCRHIHTDGRRCGSPCVRTQDFCYYHGKARRAGPRQPQVKTLADRKNSTFELPSPADLAERPGLQLAIAQVLHKIAHNELDPRRAGLLLYGLQIASMNLPRDHASRQSRAIDPEQLADEVIADDEAGCHPTPLAPEADWEDQRPKSSIERIRDAMVKHFADREPANADPAPYGDGYPSDHYPVQLHATAKPAVITTIRAQVLGRTAGRAHPFAQIQPTLPVPRPNQAARRTVPTHRQSGSRRSRPKSPGSGTLDQK